VIPYLVVFGAAAATAFVTTPLVRRMSVLFGWIDRPSDRKVHPKPTPTVGGLAIFLALLAGWAASTQMDFFDRMYRLTSEPLGALAAGGAILLIGAFDDVRGTSVPVKVAGQLLSAGLLVLFGVQLVFFWFPGQGILSLGSDLAVPLSILWVLAMVNAVNLIDGLDGLAPGLVAIASVAFFIYIYVSPASPFYGPDTGTPAALLSVIAAGAAIGFLPWNFHPAKIFMGDSGSMLLGMLLAAATISGVGRSPEPPVAGDLAAFSIPVLVPLVVLAVPFLDVVLAIVRRVRKGRAITAPDHRKAVLLMYLWSALISGSALAVALINGRLVVGLVGLGALLIIAATALPRVWWSRARRARREERLADKAAAAVASAKPPEPPASGSKLETEDTPA